MTQANFDAFDTAGGELLADWNAEPGHHVDFLQVGDVNHDTEVNGLVCWSGEIRVNVCRRDLCGVSTRIDGKEGRQETRHERT
jgi:hypothetical protein